MPLRGEDLSRPTYEALRTLQDGNINLTIGVWRHKILGVDVVQKTIDMADADGGEDASGMELDVGVLLTSLPGEDEAAELREPGERESGESVVGMSALQDLLLPDERMRGKEDDEEVGNDEYFPAFEGVATPRPSIPLDDDAEGPHES